MPVTGLDPTSGPLGGTDTKTLAPRPRSLSGEVLGLVCNGLGRGEAMLDALAANLMAGDDLAGVVKVVKGSVSIPPHPDDWSRLTEGATVAITGFGG
jgi:hypothetical protein